MISRSRLTGCDYLAACPIVLYALLALVVWIGYGDFSQWPVNSSANPTGQGFDLTGPGAVLLMFLPLMALAGAAFAVMAVTLSILSDFFESRRDFWPMLIRRGSVRLAVSMLGLVLLTPVAGRVLRWVVD